MTAAATITVKQADPPAEGKKQGKVRTDSGVFGVWPKMLGLLRPGATYEIEYEESKFDDGRTWRTISKVRRVEGSPQNDNRPTTSPSIDREFEFVTRCLPALIQICAVGSKQEGITEAARMLRHVYRDTFK